MLKERCARILRQSATPALKQQGFHRSGNVYLREVDGLLHMVDVQYSRWNDAKEVSFTLNCGVYVRGIASALRNGPEPRQPKVADCCLSARVGMVKEPFLDVWWKVSSTDGPARDGAIASEITSTLARTVLPFLERFPDMKAVAEFLSGPRTEGDKHVNPLAEGLRLAYGAIVWSAQGVRERCRKCIEQAVEKSRNTPNEGLIAAFAEKFEC